MRPYLLCGALLLSLTASAADQPSAAAPAPNGPLNCARLTWMKGCEEVNRRARENPGAPIRIFDQKGVEFAFAPGTPGVMIDMILEPNEANAARVIAWQDAQLDRAEEAAAVVRKVLMARGGERAEATAFGDAVTELREATAIPNSKPLSDAQIANVSLYVFYDSKCKPCLESLPQVAQVMGTYPGLQVTFLQINNDDRFAAELSSTIGGHRVKALTGAALRKYSTLISGTPEIWIQSNSTSGTFKLKGAQSATNLVTAIAEASK